jgi:hypothetical protein
VRSFSWLDLLTVYRYRQNVLPLDSAFLLTRGSPVGPAAVLAYLNPARGSYTGVSSLPKGGPVLIGQICHIMGDRSARISFLLPADACLSPALSSLMEGLTQQAGQWGAFNLLAEVEENTGIFGAFRVAGFTVYARQRIWQLLPRQLPEVPEKNNENNHPQDSYWKPAVPRDEIAIRSLYHAVVPALVQRAEPLGTHHLSGLVYKQEGEALAYLETITGPQGIYIQPIVHPGVENVFELLSSLSTCFTLMGRSIYLAVRSYQAWLEPALQQMNAQAGTTQALLARYLTNVQTIAMPERIKVMETQTAKPTVPVVHNTFHDN